MFKTKKGPKMRLKQHSDRQIVQKYAAAYAACFGNSQAEKGLFDRIPDSDYRSLQSMLGQVGVGIPTRRALCKAFNGTSSDVFFTYICLGARKMGIDVVNQMGLAFPAPQQR